MAKVAVSTRRAPLVRAVAVGAVLAVFLGIGASPAAAEITSVTGSAYGFWAEVSLFGGPPSERGPEPTVELEPDASDSPQQATAEDAAAVFGPATMFRSKEIEVNAEASLGDDGRVRVSSRVMADLEVETGDPQQRPGPLYYDALESTCTVDDSGEITATTTVEGGVVVTSYDPATQLPASEEDVPENPEPGYTVEGTIDHVSDRFRIVYNEQVENPDGSLTVNAAHMYLLGDIAVGDLVIGQSTCGAETSGTSTAGADTDADAAPDPGTGDDEATDDPPPDDAEDADQAAGGDSDDGVPISVLGLGIAALVVAATVVALMIGRRGKPAEDA